MTRPAKPDVGLLVVIVLFLLGLLWLDWAGRTPKTPTPSPPRTSADPSLMKGRAPAVSRDHARTAPPTRPVPSAPKPPVVAETVEGPAVGTEGTDVGRGKRKLSPDIHSGDPTAAQWAALRTCESGGNYRIVSSNGLWRGAYQFTIGTWLGVGGRGLPELASRAEQDYRALLLWRDRGWQPWPVCGATL